jgi:DNA replication protein DnaC
MSSGIDASGAGSEPILSRDRHAFFQVIAKRCERASAIATSNLPFAQ